MRWSFKTLVHLPPQLKAYTPTDREVSPCTQRVFLPNSCNKYNYKFMNDCTSDLFQTSVKFKIMKN